MTPEERAAQLDKALRTKSGPELYWADLATRLSIITKSIQEAVDETKPSEYHAKAGPALGIAPSDGPYIPQEYRPKVRSTPDNPAGWESPALMRDRVQDENVQELIREYREQASVATGEIQRLMLENLALREWLRDDAPSFLKEKK